MDAEGVRACIARHAHVADETAARADARSKAQQAQAFWESRNAGLWSGDHPRKDAARLEWTVSASGDPQLGWKLSPPSGEVDRVPLDQVERLNRGLTKFNAPFRYNRQGWPYNLQPDDQEGAQ